MISACIKKTLRNIVEDTHFTKHTQVDTIKYQERRLAQGIQMFVGQVLSYLVEQIDISSRYRLEEERNIMDTEP